MRKADFLQPAPQNAKRFKVIMRKADFLKPAFLNFVQFLGDLAFIKRYWILKRSLTWVSEVLDK